MELCSTRGVLAHGGVGHQQYKAKTPLAHESARGAPLEIRRGLSYGPPG